jgi:hypothetical protein
MKVKIKKQKADKVTLGYPDWDGTIYINRKRYAPNSIHEVTPEFYQRYKKLLTKLKENE